MSFDRDDAEAKMHQFLKEVAASMPGWKYSSLYSHAATLSYGDPNTQCPSIHCRLANNWTKDNVKITYSSSSAIRYRTNDGGMKTEDLWGYNANNEVLFETTQTSKKTPQTVANTLLKKCEGYLQEWRVQHGKFLETQDYYNRKENLASELGALIGAREPGNDRTRRCKFNFGQTGDVDFRVMNDQQVTVTLSHISPELFKKVIDLVK